MHAQILLKQESIFNPTVDPSTGKPCIDFLDNADDWQDSFNVGYILLNIQVNKPSFVYLEPYCHKMTPTERLKPYLLGIHSSSS